MSKTKQFLMAAILWLLGFGFNFLQWRLVIPTGMVIVAIGGVFFLAAMFGLGIWWSLVMLVLAAGLQLWLQPASWSMWLVIAIDWLVLACVNGWSMTQEVHLRHDQAIVFGVITGVVQLLGGLLVVVMQTARFTTSSNALSMVSKSALPGALVNALLYMALLPLLISLLRYFSEHIPPADDDPKQRHSTVIDLSNHPKNPQDK